MSKIKIKKGLVIAQGDNTITVVKNDPIKKTVSIEILNAITGETLPANLTHSEFIEKFATEVTETAKVDEINEPLPKIKMVDNSVHTYNLIDAETFELVCEETGRVQTVGREYFDHLVRDAHVKLI